MELEYDTYESMTYEEHSQVLHKRAIVYLPYGYSEEEPYNVFYLMHGGWSNETTYLGTPEQPNEFKNVLDNGIADGKIRPMIVVCPTYNNTSTEDGLRDSRDHRAFCGFSMGSVATWRTFQYCLDYFRYADNEREGNLYFLEQEGGVHSGEYAQEYFYNGLCWIWQ